MVDFLSWLQKTYLVISYKENGEILSSYSIDYLTLVVVPLVFSALCYGFFLIRKKL